jgi:hypothetical protein
MKYIEAPTEFVPTETDTSLFLAGGITGGPDWQAEMVAGLKDTSLALFNPRRENFPIHDPSAALAQITWEHKYLRVADAISFWFFKETICPIVLYELGAWSMSDKPIFVGMDPEYQRRQDVEVQTKLVRPEVEIVYSLEELTQQVRSWAKKEEWLRV